MSRWLREPLVQFLALGAVVFGVHALMRPADEPRPDRIIVTQSRLAHLATGFASTWRRPPTAAELNALVEDYVREEVYYREALAMGLERDDTVVRRRMRQKLEFVSRDVAPVVEPSDSQLQGYLEAHSDRFASQQRLTFDHVFLDPQRRGDAIARDSAALRVQLQKLERAADLDRFGDPFVLAGHFSSIPLPEVSRLFGDEFAKQLASVDVDVWTGPVASSYGSHLVRITARDARTVPPLATVREQVKRAWTQDALDRASESLYQSLRSRYVITIENEKQADAAVNSGAAAR